MLKILLIFFLNLIRLTNSSTFIDMGNEFIDCYETEIKISFNIAFIKIPQVFIMFEWVRFASGSHNLRIEIKTITLDYFIIIQSCPSIRGGWDHSIRWYAVDDQRIQIISAFNQENIINNTFPHKNPNAIKGIVSLISISYIGPVGFKLSLQDINEFNVSVIITKIAGVFENLKQIGYQILLGTEDTLLVQNIQQCDLNWISQQINKVPNMAFVTPYCGFNFQTDFTDQQKYYDYKENYLIYKILESDNIFTQNWHFQSWISINNLVFYYPASIYKIKTIQTSQNIQSQISSNIILLKVLDTEINQSGSFELILKKSNIPQVIRISVLCKEKLKVQSQYFEQKFQTNQIQMSHICDQHFNLLEYNIQWYQLTNLQLYFEISESSIKVKQTIYNYLVEQVVLFTLNLKID